jgi:hypothetical protein
METLNPPPIPPARLIDSSNFFTSTNHNSRKMSHSFVWVLCTICKHTDSFSNSIKSAQENEKYFEMNHIIFLKILSWMFFIFTLKYQFLCLINNTF